MRACHVPVEIMRLQIERVSICQQVLQSFGNLDAIRLFDANVDLAHDHCSCTSDEKLFRCQADVHSLHIVVAIDRVEERFDFFTLGRANADRILCTVTQFGRLHSKSITR